MREIEIVADGFNEEIQNWWDNLTEFQRQKWIVHNYRKQLKGVT